jgi:uncharacterized protein YvpB
MTTARERTYSLRGIALLLLLCTPLVVRAAPTAQGGTAAGTGTMILSGFPVIAQAWALSCEYAATTAATAYYGDTISQGTLLTAIGHDPNPHKGFRGSIYGGWGGITNYGVYAEPIATVLRADGFAHSYVFYGGTSILRGEIAAGHPVVTWISGTWGATARIRKVDAAGDAYSLIAYEHAVTAYGDDATGVWVMDPGVGEKYHVSWAKFEAGWNAIDDMALVVAP